MQAKWIASLGRLLVAGHEGSIEPGQRDIGDTQDLLRPIADRAAGHADRSILLGEARQSAEMAATLGVSVLQEVVLAGGGLRRIAGAGAEAISVERCRVEADELELLAA